MISAKRAAILPLCITSAIAFANGDPAVPAHRLSLARISLFEPGDNQRRFRLELAMRHIVIGKRIVEGILLRNKSDWTAIPPCAWIRIIGSAVIRRPIKVPGAPVVVDWVIASGLFSNPKHGRHDVCLPRVTLDCRAGAGGDKNLRLHLEQCLLPQFHRVLGEIRRRRIWGSGLLVPERFWDDKDRQT